MQTNHETELIFTEEELIEMVKTIYGYKLEHLLVSSDSLDCNNLKGTMYYSEKNDSYKFTFKLEAQPS